MQGDGKMKSVYTSQNMWVGGGMWCVCILCLWVGGWVGRGGGSKELVYTLLKVLSFCPHWSVVVGWYYKI